MKVINGDKENAIKGHVASGFKNPENKEVAWIVSWENENATTQHTTQEVEVWLKNANDQALVDLQLSLIKSPACFFAMSTPQPFRRRRMERANSASDG